MKRKKRIWYWIIGLAVVLLWVAAILWFMRPPANAMPTPSNGTLERNQQFTSQYIQQRDIFVWFPEGYEIAEPCDVLYMHDGQSLFDAALTWNHQEWQVDEIMGRLMQEGKIRRCIVVGIKNTDDRLSEYFPTKTWQYVPEAERKNANLEKLTGDAYLKFIVEELKPYIDECYQPLTSREHTFMMGSSMGGLISLYALCEYPEVFGGVACLSSHLSMAYLPNGNDGEAWATGFRNYVEKNLPETNTSLIYMDRGTKELDAEYGKYQTLLDKVITAKSWDEKHYKSLVFDGHGHNETCWAKRLDQPLLFLLGSQSDNEKLSLTNE